MSSLPIGAFKATSGQPPFPAHPTIGRCIYCPNEGTTDEHIIPSSLGGKLLLRDASCEACRKITSQFEETVTRDMYWPLRLRLGIEGSRKRKKLRRAHWPAILIDNDDQEEMLIEVGKLPRLYSVVEMPPPGIYSDLPLNGKNPELRLHLKGDQAELAHFARELGVERLEFEHIWHWGPFNRMLAKIAHAFCIGETGLEGVQFFLPPLILGASPDFSHYIGGAQSPSDELQPPDVLGIGLRTLNGEPHVFVRIDLLGDRRFPTYEVVVGRVEDPHLILSKMDLAAQR